MEAPDKSAVWWFQLEIQPDECPWAFVDGDSTRRIASLEMLSTLVLAAFADPTWLLHSTPTPAGTDL